jgi:hypothetical protein
MGALVSSRPPSYSTMIFWAAELPQEADGRPQHTYAVAAALQAVEVPEQPGIQTDTRRLEEEPVADPAHVHGEDLAFGDRARRATQIAGDP